MKNKTIILTFIIFILALLPAFISAINYEDSIPGLTYASIGADARLGGVGANFSTNVTIIGFNKTGSSTATKGYLFLNNTRVGGAANITLLATCTFSGNQCNYTVPYNSSITNRTFFFMTDNNGLNRNTYADTSSGFPVNGVPNALVTFTCGAFNSSSFDCYPPNAYEVTAVLYSITPIPQIPTLAFINPTPANNTLQYVLTQNNFTVNTTTTFFGGTINTTHYLYNSNGSVVQQNNGTGQANYTSTFSNLPAGMYYFNATATNGTTTNFTETRTISIYNLTPGIITNPTNGQNQTSEYLNIVWTNSTSLFNATAINNFIVKLFNSSGLVATLTTTSQLSYNWNVYQQNLSTETYQILVTANDSLGDQVNYSQVSFNLLTHALLNITAYNISLSNSISTFNITSKDLNNSADGFYNTSNGLAYINLVKGHTYNISFASDIYAPVTVQYTANSSTYQALQIITGPNNALTINIYNESSGSLITQSVSLVLTNINTGQQYTYTTTNGTQLTGNLTPGDYSLTVSSPSPVFYYPRYYNITINNNYQVVNTFLLATNYTVLMNVKTSGGAALSGILVQQYSNINGTVKLVQSIVSDVSGKAQFSYSPFTYYQFVATGTGYNTNSFALNPILFNSYDIIMTPSGQGTVVPTAFVNSYPTSFYENQNTNFNWTITSTYNGLTSYSYTFTGAGINIAHSGTNANGESFSDAFNLNNATRGDTLTLYYEYVLSNGVTYNTTIVYSINIPLYNNTLYSLGQSQDFGFALGDKVLIVVVINIICLGVGFLVFGPVGGLGLVLLNTGFWVTVGFVPAFMFYATIVIAILYVLGRGAE